MLTGNGIRRKFLEFFGAREHRIVASAPLVPRNDPSLMFVNSGMVPFKDVFTGLEQREYRSAVSVQKCVRAGGKHNDLDNVGYTARHHTFFEMLGNFSFGGYFKEHAIELAWQLVTREYDLSPDRLWVTVYHDDDEALSLWRRISGLPEGRIIRIPTGDNFWSMGDTGPCGPCSEIFFDHGPGIPGGPPGSPDAEGDRFVEIWNLVFMQYEQTASGGRHRLARPAIDTGMGLERMSAVLQGRHDNYDTDLLRPLVEAAAQLTGHDPDGPLRTGFRVIADHLRAAAFLVADGVTPANEGRGHVLRRIMRRGMRHAGMADEREPLFWRLVPALEAVMGEAWPGLVQAREAVVRTLQEEEENFRRTLARGLRILGDEVAALPPGGRVLGGGVAFRLHDTYGFPLDLTRDILRGQGLDVDTAGFDGEMARQQERARRNWAGSGEAARQEIWLRLRESCGATLFLGYEDFVAEGQILALVRDGEPCGRGVAGDRLAMIVSRTPFYGEAGGQPGDHGTVTAPGFRARIHDTQRVDDLFIHHMEVDEGECMPGQEVRLAIDRERRRRLSANHSATHLMHAALRQRLGAHVAQKGSQIAGDGLRLDFSHGAPLTDEDIDWIGMTVNRQIQANTEVRTTVMSPEDAVQAGALALFGEKYGPVVRVLSMGTPQEDGRPFSVELCGGAHVRRTGDIGYFTITGQMAISAGVRRLEAAAGEGALLVAACRLRQLQAVAGVLKTAPGEAVARAQQLQEERRRLEGEVGQLRQRLLAGGGDAAVVRDAGGVPFVSRIVREAGGKEVRALLDAMKAQTGSGIVAVVNVDGEKVSLAVGVSGDLLVRFDAAHLAGSGARVLEGRGGGRRDFAQAGGRHPDRVREALDSIFREITAVAGGQAVPSGQAEAFSPGSEE